MGMLVSIRERKPNVVVHAENMACKMKANVRDMK